MGTWTTKFRNSALVASVLAISLAVNPASAGTSGSHGDKGAAKRGMAGFTGGAIIGAAAGGPLGMVVGAVGMVGCGGGDNKGSATPEATSTSEAAPAASQGTAKECCKGHNDCKGQGNCKVEGKNECKGKNDCKGQGGCKPKDCS